jgi:hypothetical protein
MPNPAFRQRHPTHRQLHAGQTSHWSTVTHHLCDSRGEQTSERASKRGRREERSSADTQLSSLVPTGKIVVHTCEILSIDLVRHAHADEPGNNPASARPKNQRQASSPE